MTTSIVNEAVKYCKSMINDDIMHDLVPKGIKSFNEIHEYVDANKYFIEALGTDIDFDELIEIANQVQVKLDQWIKGGM